MIILDLILPSILKRSFLNLSAMSFERCGYTSTTKFAQFMETWKHIKKWLYATFEFSWKPYIKIAKLSILLQRRSRWKKIDAERIPFKNAFMGKGS